MGSELWQLNLIITNERVDDIPILLTQIQQMGIGKLMDKHFPTHGNWQGESLGRVAVIWLTHITHRSLKVKEKWGQKKGKILV